MDKKLFRANMNKISKITDHIGFSGQRAENQTIPEKKVSGDSFAIDTTDYPEEMKDCIELDRELDDYFLYLSKLSKDELLTIVKYEVYNRVLGTFRSGI